MLFLAGVGIWGINSVPFQAFSLKMLLENNLVPADPHIDRSLPGLTKQGTPSVG